MHAESIAILLGEEVPSPRTVLPEVAKRLTEVVVDNPMTMGLVFASSFLLPRVAVRLVRPRTPLEGLALLFLLSAGTGYAVTKLTGPGGLMELKLRDHVADSPDPAA